MPPPLTKPKCFSDIKSPEDLAAFLRLPLGQLQFHARNSAKYYYEFRIKKRSGGMRVIHAPSNPLRSIQQTIAQAILAQYKPRPSVRGFTSGQSILTNAAPHSAKKLVLNIDLEEFFPSIHRGRVVGALKAKPFELSQETAKLIADLCCLGGRLPQGAPTSPVISNIICWNLDRALERLAGRYYCYYTRYADDITFSTNARMFPAALLPQNEALSNAPSELEQVILANGFTINKHKTRLLSRSRRQTVTGLVVNEFPNVDRRFIRQIRAMLHSWEKNKLEKAQADYQSKYWHPKISGRPTPDFRRVLLGKISFVGQVRSTSSKLYLNLLKKYAKLNPAFKLPPEPPHRKDIVQLAYDCTWVLESESNSSQGTGFMLAGVGIVTCAHVLAPGTHAFRSSPEEVGKKFDIKIIHKDTDRDIAVVQLLGIDQAMLPSMERANSESLKPLSQLVAVGYANYNPGHSPDIKPCQISGFFKRKGERRIRVNTGIIAGMSGGPVTLPSGRVIGIAVTGADNESAVEDPSVEHGVIPIELLDKLSH